MGFSMTPDDQLSDAYAQYVNGCRRIDPAEQIELVRRIQADQGDEEAKRLLVDSCIRLVLSVAQRYNGYGVPLEDLVQQGVIGLFKAVERFDSAKYSNRFSTYATPWIRQTVMRYLADTKRTIRLPVYRNDQIVRIGKLRAKAMQELGHDPSGQELEDLVKRTEARLWGMTVRELIQFQEDPMSLDRPAIEDGETLGDLTPEDSISPDESAELAERNETLHKLVDALSNDRERTVLQMYYGLPPYSEGRTLEEIGKCFGVSRERIRQLKSDAIRHLRHPRNRRQLKEFL